MPNSSLAIKKILPADLARLIDHLQILEYKVMGPTVREAAIVYDQIKSIEDLPKGWKDEQEGGYYRLINTGSNQLFDYAVGPDSWKKYLYPKEEVVYSTQLQNGDLIFTTADPVPAKQAFFGIRSCELSGIAILDKVFLNDSFVDGGYAVRRNDLLLIAVNCSRSGNTCFCTSVDSGPGVHSGFDLALTEIYNGEHYFTLEVGSELGASIVENLNFDEADDIAMKNAKKQVEKAKLQQRKLNTNGLKERIYQNLENQPFWEDVAYRCLNCANCTLVCPTCFCSNVEDITQLDGNTTDRVRHWDSCFNLSHSHIAGDSVRQSGSSRYRQWFSHKLASWQDQFDTLGCVGCGRCITWCPVGIDITAEVARLETE